MPAPRVEVLGVGHSAYDLTLRVEGFPRERSKLAALEMLAGGKALDDAEGRHFPDR
jgi:hypothetical protein